ncbi:FtsX-like permease family protein [Hoeflea sp. YIM 152468]|uniref:ABC transporter permease n=1 Tax=Hoeflea sp. YIM 152468 TaxID=3031759 RepID=UPI0023D9FE01|nr:FtsX-like permease family protein [Hoeflea sp. YIM 152468]MDF1608533.1 FtsX-like permease family protein [Hoeflea sp. YIM 152468]
MLDRKLVRDLVRLWAQSLAVALVMACGVMTLILALGATRALEDTRAAFYDRTRFGHVFATAIRAPESLGTKIAAIDGVAAVATRIVHPVIIDIDGMAEPATGQLISIPDHGEAAVNRLYLRSGRLPEPGRPDEVTVIEAFAEAHGFRSGDSFAALINGRKRQLRITGVTLSPEHVYAIGPGDIVPDQKRYGVVHMRRTTLDGAYDMQSAFNSVSLTLSRHANKKQVMARLDAILKPYGGVAAHDRSDHPSDAFLDAELVQLKAMAQVIPPIFLFISAFLVNMILSRLIALEREQIGLLKAVGYSNSGIAWHYAKLTLVISVAGVIIGAVAGTRLGHGMASLYSEFFSFPFLVFSQRPDLYVIATLVTFAAALAGAANAIRGAVRLPPAVAMRPPAPTRYRSLFGGADSGFRPLFSHLTVMALRHLVRWPVRTALTTLGTALPVALLITSLFAFDSIDSMIDTVWFRADRQDATLTFAASQSEDAIRSVAHLPGVIAAEPFRAEAATLRHGHLSRQVQIIGTDPHTDISRVLDRDFRPVRLPPNGLLLSERLASHLDLRPGDAVEVELRNGQERRVLVPLVGVTNSYIGLNANMSRGALDRLSGQAARISGARVIIDDNRTEDLYDAVKQTPAIASVALQGVSREKFRAMIEENIGISVTVYVSLAIIITVGVIYNSARIQLSERARELASLRVFGFTNGEVSRVLLTELGVMVVLAQPLGWLIGRGFSELVATGFESDLFRIPLVITPPTYALSSLVVLGAALVSALIVRRRIDRLDLIRVLKTRD